MSKSGSSRDSGQEPVTKRGGYSTPKVSGPVIFPKVPAGPAPGAAPKASKEGKSGGGK